MQARICKAHEGRRLDIFGNELIEKASSQDMGDGAAVFVQTVMPNGGPPPHFHETTDEFFYVLEGEIEVWVGGRHCTLKPGMSAVLPRGIAHRFDNVTDQPAKVLAVVSPGTGARFFDDIDRERPRLPQEIDKLGAILARHDIQFLGQLAA